MLHYYYPLRKQCMAKRSKKAAKLADAAPPGPEKGVCFVIMPFGGWLDDYYKSIYCPAIDAVGLEPHRADDLFFDRARS